MRAVVAYIPVLHEGYRRLLDSHRDTDALYLIGPELTAEFRDIQKEIRALDPELVREAVSALGLSRTVQVLDTTLAHSLDDEQNELVLPDEEVSRTVASTYFPRARVTFEPVFLRWDKHSALKERPVVPDEEVTHDEFHRRVLSGAQIEAEKSSDIWRRVGAAVARDGKVILEAHNAHVPSEHMPFVNGDPRSAFHRGDHIELSTALHAEAGVIAEAARRGIPLEGADMYVTVFPCPPCAKLVAYAGIKNLYCGGGYAVLDGQDILKSRGVKIIFVE